jgi:RNA polymerase sigma-70 factor (ECF subfamily)
LSQVQKRPDQQFEALVLPHLDALYRAAVAMCGQSHQADDLVQATVLKALEAFGSFTEGTNGRAWLLRILRNTWVDLLRRRKTAGMTLPIDEDLLAQADGPQETKWIDSRDLLENFADEEVIKALSELPADQRLTLYLVDVEQMSHEEAADILDVPVGTVKSRASRARHMLSDRLKERAKDLGFMGRVHRESPERRTI